MLFDLKKVEELGSLFYSISEVSIMLEVPIDKLTDEDSNEYKAYQKGFLNSEIELRKEILETAKTGSPNAQETINKIIKSAKTTNSRYA